MNVRQSTWRVLVAVSALTLVLAAASVAAPEGTLAEPSAAGSRLDFRPLASFQCLRLTVTGPELTFEKAFGSGAYPSFELPSGAADGTYRWQLTRSEQACDAKPETVASSDEEDDTNGRSRGLGGRAPRKASGPYVQSGAFRVTNGSIAIPSDLIERRK
jgi:hypothetical protein